MNLVIKLSYSYILLLLHNKMNFTLSRLLSLHHTDTSIIFLSIVCIAVAIKNNSLHFGALDVADVCEKAYKCATIYVIIE